MKLTNIQVKNAKPIDKMYRLKLARRKHKEEKASLDSYFSFAKNSP
jgi:hypothetical protein